MVRLLSISRVIKKYLHMRYHNCLITDIKILYMSQCIQLNYARTLQHRWTARWRVSSIFKLVDLYQWEDPFPSENLHALNIKRVVFAKGRHDIELLMDQSKWVATQTSKQRCPIHNDLRDILWYLQIGIEHNIVIIADIYITSANSVTLSFWFTFVW